MIDLVFCGSLALTFLLAVCLTVLVGYKFVLHRIIHETLWKANNQVNKYHYEEWRPWLNHINELICECGTHDKGPYDDEEAFFTKNVVIGGGEVKPWFEVKNNMDDYVRKNSISNDDNKAQQVQATSVPGGVPEGDGDQKI